MREFLKAIHDYPDEATGIGFLIFLTVWIIIMYKVYKDK